MKEPEAFKHVDDTGLHFIHRYEIAGTQSEPLYSVYTFLAWLKDNRRRATKDYGQAAEQGTKIEKTFEAGFSSAMDHLVDEFKEEFEIYDGPQNVEELEEEQETLSEDKAGTTGEQSS